MSKIAKAYAITDAKISFVSLVNKAANKKQFLITKSCCQIFHIWADIKNGF